MSFLGGVAGALRDDDVRRPSSDGFARVPEKKMHVFEKMCTAGRGSRLAVNACERELNGDHNQGVEGVWIWCLRIRA